MFFSRTVSIRLQCFEYSYVPSQVLLVAIVLNQLFEFSYALDVIQVTIYLVSAACSFSSPRLNCCLT